MEMEKEIIYVDRPSKKINRNNSGAATIKIDSEAADILESFASTSGGDFSKIASSFIKYAADRAVIRERMVE